MLRLYRFIDRTFLFPIQTCASPFGDLRTFNHSNSRLVNLFSFPLYSDPRCNQIECSRDPDSEHSNNGNIRLPNF